MTEPDDRAHSTEPAEGGDPPGTGDDVGAHAEEPAEGQDVDQPGDDTPDS
jgi:hypothetical protein